MQSPKKINSRNIAILGIFAALTLIVSVIEHAMPPIVAFLPYAKIGLSNVFILFILVFFNIRYTLIIVLIKSSFIAIFSGSVMSIFYSLPAGVISSIIMWLLIKYRLSLISISVLSALAHNITQIAVAIMITKTISVIAYLPHLMLVATITGALIGALTLLIIKKMPIENRQF